MLVKPSITFNGQAEEAILFYQKVFGGEIDNLFRFGESPKNTPYANVTDAEKNRVMNARLTFGGNQFNVADCLPFEEISIGGNIKLDIVFSQSENIEEVFDLLSEGGKVVMPLTKLYYTPACGEIIDKFGVRWELMVM